MKRLLVIHTGHDRVTTTVPFLGEHLRIDRVGCAGDTDRARALIEQSDANTDAIALDGMPVMSIGGNVRPAHVPVVDGRAVRHGLERWGVTLLHREQPTLVGGKKVLLVPDVEHTGLVDALTRRSRAVRFARLHAASEKGGRSEGQFRWAEVIAGDVGAIRRHAPERLDGKTIVVECATEADLQEFGDRGARVAVTLMPGLDGKGSLGQWSAAVIEGMIAAVRPHPVSPLSDDACLDTIADLDWSPAVRYLQPTDQGVNRFAFVIHPLSIDFIHKHPQFWWTRYFPDRIVERVAARFPPMYVSTIRGAQSPATGQRVEGHLIALGATPREMMRRDEQFTYAGLRKAARMAERRGARIMGLGAFTSVVGDAGITVAKESDIAITSGNSLTVAATLEAAKQAVLRMGAPDLASGKAMVVGATGSIGSVCARLLAQAIFDVVLVSIEPERLIELKRIIKAETPAARVSIGMHTAGLIDDCDLVVTATSAFGQRVVDIARCKPGAVICDVARPPDISAAEAAVRRDVLVIEAGEVLIPGPIDIGYDIGLPPHTSYACLAETVLLAMEGRFEDYTLGREIEIGRVKEIYRLFKKHGFTLAGLRSFGKYVTDEDVAAKRRLADTLRADPALLARVRSEAAARLATIPACSKAVRTDRGGVAARLRETIERSHMVRPALRRAPGNGQAISEKSPEVHMPPAREPLTGIDSAWLHMDDDDNLMVVTLVMVLERPVTYGWVRRLIESRLLKIPRFRQRIVGGRWEDDPHFDVDQQLEQWDLYDPLDETELHRRVSAAMSQPLDPSRPLWRFYFVPQYGGGSAIVVRIHHCIGDGLALIYTFLSMADEPESHPVPGCGRPVERAVSWREIAGRAITGLTTTAKLLVMSRDRPTALKGPLGIEKRATWSKPVPLDRVKAASRLKGASLNDILLTAVTGALHQYLVARGLVVDEDLTIRSLVPVNLRKREDAHLLGNRFGLVFLTMPVGLADPAERLAEIGRRMSALKGSLEPYVTYQILRVLGLAPRRVFDFFIRMFGRKGTAVITNVIGPQEPIAFGGIRLSQAMFWVPCAGKLGLGISVLSYAGHVSVGFAGDAALVPDPEALVAYFDVELERLIEPVQEQPAKEQCVV